MPLTNGKKEGDSAETAIDHELHSLEIAISPNPAKKQPAPSSHLRCRSGSKLGTDGAAYESDSLGDYYKAKATSTVTACYVQSGSGRQLMPLDKYR